jgi:hypothetical protein
MVRAKDYIDGIAYYYIVSCDGHYNLEKQTAGGTTKLLESPSSDVINKGSNQTNTLGIWIKGSTIRLYANNHFLTEVTDKSIDTDGHFGFFVNSNQTRISPFTWTRLPTGHWTEPAQLWSPASHIDG